MGANCQGNKGGGSLAIVFRSRPLFVNLSSSRGRAARDWEGDARRRVSLPAAWHASVRDEIHATASGALLRRIRILITDGTQFEPEEVA